MCNMKTKDINMKTKDIDTDELRRLKIGYYSETLWNKSYSGKNKPSYRCKKLLKSKYGIIGRNAEIIMCKIDKMIRSC